MHVPAVTPGRIARSAAGAIVALSLVTGAMAANADGKSASTALPLSGLATGSIAGSSAGSYAFYTFGYPGDGSTGTLSYTISPNDPVTDNAVGVNIYQGSTLLASGNGLGNPPGTGSLAFSSTTPGPILVQVYDYGQGLPANFQLQVQGVPGVAPIATTPRSPAPAAASTSASTTAPAPTNGTADKPVELKGTLTGSLPGSTAGSYAYFTAPYPGDGSFQSVNVSFTPTGPDTANGVVVNVYQNGTQLESVAGNDNGSNTPGNLTIQYTSTTAGPIVFQIGNYNPSGSINYSIGH
jgi:hypothetical protein